MKACFMAIRLTNRCPLAIARFMRMGYLSRAYMLYNALFHQIGEWIPELCCRQERRKKHT